MLNQYQLINLLHILIIAPLLTYIAYKGYYKEEINSIFYVILFIFAVWSFVYHLIKLLR